MTWPLRWGPAAAGKAVAAGLPWLLATSAVAQDTVGSLRDIQAEQNRVQIEGVDIVVNDELSITLDYLEIVGDGWRKTRVCFHTPGGAPCRMIVTPATELPSMAPQIYWLDKEDSWTSHTPAEGERVVAIEFQYRRGDEDCYYGVRLMGEGWIEADHEHICTVDTQVLSRLEDEDRVVVFVRHRHHTFAPRRFALRLEAGLVFAVDFWAPDSYPAISGNICFIRSGAAELCRALDSEFVVPLGSVRRSVSPDGQEVIGVDLVGWNGGAPCLSAFDLIGGDRAEYRRAYVCEAD